MRRRVSGHIIDPRPSYKGAMSYTTLPLPPKRHKTNTNFIFISFCALLVFCVFRIILNIGLAFLELFVSLFGHFFNCLFLSLLLSRASYWSF